nr:helix-turn-helix domain-containing protein [Salinispora arenicola]
MTGLPGPSLCRRRVRTQLTCLRRQHHRLTDAQISAEMDWSVSKTRRLFAGNVSFSRADLRQMLTLLGLTETPP